MTVTREKVWGNTGRVWNTVTPKLQSLEGWSPGTGSEQRHTRISFYCFGPDSTTGLHGLHRAPSPLVYKAPIELEVLIFTPSMFILKIQPCLVRAHTTENRQLFLKQLNKSTQNSRYKLISGH